MSPRLHELHVNHGGNPVTCEIEVIAGMQAVPASASFFAVQMRCKWNGRDAASDLVLKKYRVEGSPN